jgi:zinc transport system substrate-binding protein
MMIKALTVYPGKWEKEMKTITKLILFMLLYVIIPSHAFALGGNEKKDDSRIKVFCSILPLVYFSERIGGEHIDAESLVPPGQEPHTYEPTPHQMANLSSADMYFSIGVPFEKVLLPKLRESIQGLTIIDAGATIRLRHFNDTDHHRDEGSNDHHHGKGDPHIWLSPALVKTISANICDALVGFDPEKASYYKSNYALFMKDIDRLHKSLTEVFGSYKGRRFFVFHPAFGYFADEYGLIQVAIETEGKQPGARQLARLIEMAQEHNVKIIFTQVQFSQQKPAIIADAIDGVVVPIDPLAEDWLSNMKYIAEEIKKGLF